MVSILVHINFLSFRRQTTLTQQSRSSENLKKVPLKKGITRRCVVDGVKRDPIHREERDFDYSDRARGHSPTRKQVAGGKKPAGRCGPDAVVVFRGRNSRQNLVSVWAHREVRLLAKLHRLRSRPGRPDKMKISGFHAGNPETGRPPVKLPEVFFSQVYYTIIKLTPRQDWINDAKRKYYLLARFIKIVFTMINSLC